MGFGLTGSKVPVSGLRFAGSNLGSGCRGNRAFDVAAQ
jgi:hypothetical protein